MKVQATALVAALVFAGVSYSEPVTAADFTAAAWFSEKPTSITILDRDHIVGTMASGATFSQYRIVTATNVRIHKFVFADNSFYISDKGLFEAASDLEAVSIYLTLG